MYNCRQERGEEGGERREEERTEEGGEERGEEERKEERREERAACDNFSYEINIHCVSKKFSLLLFAITKSDIDRFQ